MFHLLRRNGLDFRVPLTVGLPESRFYSVPLSRHYFLGLPAILGETAKIIRAVRANTNSCNRLDSSTWWGLLSPPTSYMRKREAASEPCLYSLQVVYAWKLLCDWVRLAGGARETKG